MTTLMVRRPPFQIDASVPFQWQPSNPSFELFGNAFTFLAVAFEKYIVAATREAMSRITDPDIAEEADAFLRQEAQHARAHRAHARAMIEQYPGLDDTFAAVNAAYDDLLEGEDVEFHLAYIANLEATFTPLFKMVFDNRRPLFEGGDERVGTLRKIPDTQPRPDPRITPDVGRRVARRLRRERGRHDLRRRPTLNLG